MSTPYTLNFCRSSTVRDSETPDCFRKLPRCMNCPERNTTRPARADRNWAFALVSGRSSRMEKLSRINGESNHTIVSSMTREFPGLLLYKLPSISHQTQTNRVSLECPARIKRSLVYFTVHKLPHQTRTRVLLECRM